jgi:hypothetical protein
MRIVASANVTLRTLPSSTAAAVTQLPLGTEVAETGPTGADKTWVRVRLDDGREGWIASSFTKTLDRNWRWPTYDRIIEERLGRKGDGFPALAELVAFIERVAPEYTDPDGRARVDLARLRATSAALAAIPQPGRDRGPYRAWAESRRADIGYDEPGGRWMVKPQAAWALADTHAQTSAADDIAWFAVTNGLGGECEGHLPCYVAWSNSLDGEYLRRQPRGSHAEEAVAAIKKMADILSQPTKPGEAAYEFDRARDCRDLTTSVDALAAAIRSARTPSRDAALASLDALRKLCSGGDSLLF